MLHQIIRSISRSILGRVADSNEKLKNSISENASKAAAFEQQQTQTNKQLLADLEGKEKRIGDNTLGVQGLQTKTTQLSSDLTETNKQVSGLKSNFETKHGELSKAHYDFEAVVKKQYDDLTGLIDDKNLDSIREIADRIKAEAQESQTIRQDMQNADNALHGKIDALLPKELQNKTVAEWEQFIEDIVAQEIASQEAAATR